jgi:uncharacterized protein YmfQ (DUF2313 family)
MSYANLQPPDFESGVWKLRPPGLAWAAGIGSVLRGFWAVVGDAIAAVHARAAVLTERESFPPWSIELLPDWETVFGLPDPCAGVAPTIAARQAAVGARLGATGGQSIPYYETVAQSLGGTVTITEYAPMRWGINAWGQPLYTPGWAYVWTATLTGAAIFRLTWGGGAWGEPFWQIQNDPVACELQRLKPAHTILFFAVAPGVPTARFTLGVSSLGGPDTLG